MLYSNYRKYLPFLTGTFFISFSIYSQADLQNQTDPFSWVEKPRYTVDAGKHFNDPVYYSHPDFGVLPFSAPYGKTVVEDLSKRTLDERYYVDLNDNAFFYIEKSSQPINFYQGDILRAIDPSLHRINDFYYESGPQPVPTALDLMNHRVLMKIDEDYLGFSNLKLETVDMNGITTLSEPDWSQVTVGNFGAIVTDLFSGIDLKITFRQGGFKTEFVIKQNPGVKALKFIDEFDLPDHYQLIMDGNEITSLYVQVYNTETGETDIVIDPARTSDQSGSRTSWLNPYSISDNTLTILCDSLLLNGSDKIYPLVIDPLFTAVGPVTSAFGIRGSLLSPASCTNALNVTFPGGSTPWDVSASWTVYTDFCARTLLLFGFYDDCYMSDAQVWLTSSCGGASPVGAPGTIWTCVGCNSIGTWNPTLPFASSGTQSLAQCYTPSCANQTLTFNMLDNRSYCTSYSFYDNCTWADSYCVSLDQWSVTVQGRTIETLGNTATGNGSQTINDADCIGTTLLNPTPLYGVAPYTYSWSTGAVSPTITVGVTPAVYTCTVTTACGSSVVATFNIGCPLPLRLDDLVAASAENGIKLSWTTFTENGMQKFVVQRMLANESYVDVAAVDASGTENGNTYELTDLNPQNGINYYRLLVYYDSGESETTETVQAFYEPKQSIQIIPNPNTGSFEIHFTAETGKESFIEVLDLSGKSLYTKSLPYSVENVNCVLNLPAVPPGIYTLKIDTGTKVLSERLVIR